MKGRSASATLEGRLARWEGEAPAEPLGSAKMIFAFPPERRRLAGRGAKMIFALPSPHGVDLRLTVWNANASEVDGWLEEAVALVRPLLGKQYYAEGDKDLAAVVLDALAESSHRLAVAESCTGGLIGERLTAIPGSSAVFAGGVVAYDDKVKENVLGVPRRLLEENGAVSEPVAEAMAQGVAMRLGSSASLAITGVAGPTGGTPEKPVGTVCIAAGAGEARRVVTLRLPGDRIGIRHRGAQAALNLVRGLLS